MGDQTQAYDIFQTPLSSGYPLPLSVFPLGAIPGELVFRFHEKNGKNHSSILHKIKKIKLIRKSRTKTYGAKQ